MGSQNVTHSKQQLDTVLPSFSLFIWIWIVWKWYTFVCVTFGYVWKGNFGGKSHQSLAVYLLSVSAQMALFKLDERIDFSCETNGEKFRWLSRSAHLVSIDYGMFSRERSLCRFACLCVWVGGGGGEYVVSRDVAIIAVCSKCSMFFMLRKAFNTCRDKLKWTVLRWLRPAAVRPYSEIVTLGEFLSLSDSISCKGIII